MAITYRSGNLLEADVEALVNTVNCVGVMGKGIALQFRQAFPDNYRAYQKACRAHEVQPGRMFIVPTGSEANPKYIVNFPTKRHFRDKSRLSDIEAGLAALVEDIRRLGIRSLALPPLGCGNGGLSWSDVGPLITGALAALPEVDVHVFPPQDAPPAEAMPVSTQKPEMTPGRASLIRLIELYAIPGYELTKLEVQKLAYFLQAAGEPLRLRYAKHIYGPYAENLNHVLQRIEGHYLRGYGDRSHKRSRITLLPGASEAARAALVNRPDASARLQRVASLIEGFENPYGMELLSTVHWMAHEDPAAARDVERAVAGVQAWSERKRCSFRPAHLHTAWQRLQAQGWL
jgi:O-acetyl-ADP-ribose deacetylase (regulator of RNase III)